MAQLTALAGRLQDLLGPEAEAVAVRHGLIQRHRKFSGSSLLATFVLGCWRSPEARPADLAVTAASLGVDVSAQAIAKRRTPALRDALRDLLHAALGQAVAGPPRTTELLSRFPAVFVGDSSTITLTAALAPRFPGTGGDAGPAALKLQVQWEMQSGGLQMAIERGKQSDSTSPLVAWRPPAGSLMLRDLGYFRLARFHRWSRRGIRWISRALHNLTVSVDGHSDKLIRWVAKQKANRIDREVTLGSEGKTLTCRLVAFRLPPAQAAKKRRAQHRTAQKKGRVPSDDRLAACDWVILITNLPADEFDAEAVQTLYRLRWQIELLFKLWKSHGKIDDHRSDDPVLQLLVLYARLLAVLLQHWVMITLGWSVPSLSLVKAATAVRETLLTLLTVWSSRTAFVDSLNRLAAVVRRCRVDRRRQKPSTFQTLEKKAKT